MSNLPMKIDPPLVITLANQGSGGWGVQHDGAGVSGLTWSEMLAQVAVLTAHDKAEAGPFDERPLTITIVNQERDGWSLLIDGAPAARGLCFDELLGEIARRAFPRNHRPGAPLFKKCQPAATGAAIDEVIRCD